MEALLTDLEKWLIARNYKISKCYADKTLLLFGFVNEQGHQLELRARPAAGVEAPVEILNSITKKEVVNVE